MLSLARETRAASDAASRFACIARLAREWHGVEPIGYDAQEIAEAASRLGITVPASVRRWYETFAGTKGVAFGQNRVIRPAHWKLIEGELTVAAENQGNWYAVVGLDGDDPPVRAVGWHEGALSASFSRHALQTALFESVVYPPGGDCIGNADGDLMEWLEQMFGAPVVEPWPDAGPGPVTFYLGLPGIAFLQPDDHGLQWIYIGLVDDDAVRREIERTAPVDEWVAAPTDGA